MCVLTHSKSEPSRTRRKAFPTLLRSRHPPFVSGNTGPSKAPSRTRRAFSRSTHQDGSRSRRSEARDPPDPADRLSEVATVQYAKVAEFQRHGAGHFHALIRLDGPQHIRWLQRRPHQLTAGHLADLVQRA